MENFYPYSENEMKDFAAQRKFDSLLRQYNWHKSRFDRGLYGTAVTPEHLAGIKLTCTLLWRDMMEIDPVRCCLEVRDLCK